MKVWVFFLLTVFVIAVKPGSTRPKTLGLSALCVGAAMLLYSTRFA